MPNAKRRRRILNSKDSFSCLKVHKIIKKLDLVTNASYESS